MKARPWVGAWAWVEGEARAALLGSEQLQEGVWLPRWFAATPHPSPLSPGGVSIALGAGCGLRGEKKSLGWADVQAQGLLNRLSWSQGRFLMATAVESQSDPSRVEAPQAPPMCPGGPQTP